MTDTVPPGPADDPDEDVLAEVFDELLQEVLDGRTPDLDRIRPGRPDLRARIQESWALACSVAGRREPGRPVLGGYEILRELGRGGMGTVYLARHQALEREVAIKVLPHSLALSPRAKVRFLSEARALARLRHDHVVRIHRIIDDADMLAFEMEFVDGPSLQNLLLDLRQDGPTPTMDRLATLLHTTSAGLDARSPVEFFVKLGIAMARALGEVHRHGLIHRDIKPSNILLRRGGKPVLADFGLVRNHDLTATQAGSFAGTPIYAAPERLREGDEAIDGRADIYSLGVTLYEAITLTPPYQGRSTAEVLRKIEGGQVVPLRRLAPHASRDLQTVLAKAMEPDPRHRYATADEFAADLERLLALQPIHASPASLGRRAVQFARRNQRTIAAALAGALLVAAVAWPQIASARAASTAAGRAATALHAARLQLVQSGSLPLRAAGVHAAADGAAVSDQVAALDAALRHYADAAAIAGSTEGFAAELAAVETVRWLRTESPDTPEAVRRTRADQRLQTLLAPLPPVAREAAQAWVSGRPDPQWLSGRLADAPADTRFVTGLLALLLSDLAACEACWDHAAIDQTTHPLLDAGLGLMHAADGAPERAYPRLFHAMRSFPDSDALALEFADVALAMGDADPARQWLQQHGAQPGRAASPRLALLAADVAVAEGDAATATTRLLALLRTGSDEPGPVHRLARIAIARGEHARARQLLDMITQRWPEYADAQVDLARIALRRRDLPAYLGRARHALMELQGGQCARGTRALLHEVLRVGGLAGLCQRFEQSRGSLRSQSPVDLPMSDWAPPAAIAATEQLLELLTAWDRAQAGRSVHLGPVVAGVIAAFQVGALHPNTLRALPVPAVLAFGTCAPPIAGWLAPVVARQLLPYQRSLGGRLEIIEPEPVCIAERDPDWHFGHSLVRIPDVDGDGWADLLIGCPPARSASYLGHAQVRSSADGRELLRLECDRDDVLFGISVAGLDDVDRDGHADWLVGAPIGSQQVDAPGMVQVRSGRSGAVLRELSGDSVGFGVSVAALEDVDGDGVGDFAVGSAPVLRNSAALGAAEVFSGADGHRLARVTADRAGVWFGATVANAGDVDADGHGDLIVGGQLGPAPGLVVVFSPHKGRALHTWSDSHEDTAFGRCVGTVGDIDRDGHADLLVGAPGVGETQHPGHVLLFSGRTGDQLARLAGDRAGDAFGIAFCLLPDWHAPGRPGLAIGAGRGGPAGGGYVRVFTLDRLQPTRSYFGSNGAWGIGTAIAPLDSRSGDLRSDLGCAVQRGPGTRAVLRFTNPDRLAVRTGNGR